MADKEEDGPESDELEPVSLREIEMILAPGKRPPTSKKEPPPVPAQKPPRPVVNSGKRGSSRSVCLPLVPDV